MTITFVSNQTFAGGFDVGATQAGLKMIHKMEMAGGFGMANCLANRGVLGDDWTFQTCAAEEWEPVQADVVLSNPPCSAWSRLSDTSFRGIDSPISGCMLAFADYVGKVSPQIAIMESVQQAHREGLSLMHQLHARVEALTKKRYFLTHVLHNNASVGGCSIRRRYFLVLSRLPFGIEREPVTRVPNLLDAIGDLRELANTWEAQPYRRPASWWAEPQRRADGLVDGHFTRTSPWLARSLDLLRECDVWAPGEKISVVARRYHAQHGKLPESWGPVGARLIERNFENLGYSQLKRWRGDRMARVIVGDGASVVLHPTEDRIITEREVARIMGFPDDWLIAPIKDAPGLKQTWGKGVSGTCGRWIARWARAALEGQPGAYRGEPGGQDRERVIDVTEDYRAVCQER